MKVGSCRWAKVLLFLGVIVLSTLENLQHFFIVDAEWHLEGAGEHLLFLLRAQLVYTLHFVDSNEVGHPCVHFLAIEQLKSQILIRRL